MRPDCIGTRMATIVMHFTVFFVFHGFCIATDAHAVAAAACNASLERRRYWEFLCGALANGFLYFESLAVGVQAHRAAAVLLDFSCVTPDAEMPVIDTTIFWLWEQANLEMGLFISAVTFPALVTLLLFFKIVPRDLAINQLAVVNFLARIRVVPADYALAWLREWLVCTNDLAKKKKKKDKNKKVEYAAEDLRGRHSVFWFRNIEYRNRVYGRVFNAKRWPTGSVIRARSRTISFLFFGLPHPLGYLFGLFANCISYTQKFFPSDEAPDVLRSMRAHGPVVNMLYTVARLLPFAGLCMVRPGQPVNDLVFAGAGLRALTFFCSHYTESGTTLLGNAEIAPPPPPPPPPPA